MRSSSSRALTQFIGQSTPVRSSVVTNGHAGAKKGSDT
jgi:hypothetical protein